MSEQGPRDPLQPMIECPVCRGEGRILSGTEYASAGMMAEIRAASEQDVDEIVAGILSDVGLIEALRYRVGEAIRAAVAAEREACARVAEYELSVDAGDPGRWTDRLVKRIAAQIRSRKP